MIARCALQLMQAVGNLSYQLLSGTRRGISVFTRFDDFVHSTDMCVFHCSLLFNPFLLLHPCYSLLTPSRSDRPVSISSLSALDILRALLGLTGLVDVSSL